jgi:hypothetical protein
MFHKQSPTIDARITRRFTDRQRRIYEFLCENPVGVLCTITPEYKPHGSVIYFNVEDDFQITFLTRSRTRKHDNLMRNSYAMLTVFEPRTQTTAQITGRAAEITDSYDVNAIAVKVLRASMNTSEGGIPPIAKLESGPFVAFSIEPIQIRWAVFARPYSGDMSDMFESLESFELHD